MILHQRISGKRGFIPDKNGQYLSLIPGIGIPDPEKKPVSKLENRIDVCRFLTPWNRISKIRDVGYPKVVQRTTRILYQEKGFPPIARS